MNTQDRPNASQRHRGVSYPGKTFGILVLVLAIAAGSMAAALADDSPKIHMKSTIVLNNVGDAHLTVEVKMPANLYTIAKTNNPNTAVLLRRLGIGQGWAEVDGLQGRFDDSTSTVVIELCDRGAARPTDDRSWSLPLTQASRQMGLVASFDRTVIFNAAANTDFGLATTVVRVEAPEGARDLKLSHNPERLTYRLPVPKGGDDPAVDFRLEAKAQIMSCLAKSYGNEQFDHLWTARSMLKNTGDQTLENFRIRFRLEGYSAWSDWKRTARVVPGETVADAFFPVFDLDKIAGLTGPRPIMLEMEYEYQTADGRKVHESDTRRVELLGRNEVVFSSIPEDEAVGFFDQTNNAPLIVASMVTSSDPVMQQVAGGVSRLAGGPAASSTPEDAAKFLATLYDFLSKSNIAYQTPPGRTFEGHQGQHIKFGRDVLRARAGTCVDLAILYASVCESVGLKTMVFVIPGHAFPAVYLPNGNLIPVETTLIGHKDFKTAVKTGVEEAKRALTEGRVHKVNIRQMHDLGVHAIDLPPVEPDYLAKLGYNFEPGNRGPAVLVHQTTSTQPSPAPANTEGSSEPATASPIVGKWGFLGNVSGSTIAIAAELTANGTYVAQRTVISATGQTDRSREMGPYVIQGQSIAFYPGGASTPIVRRFSFRGPQLLVEFAELHQVFAFQRLP